MIIPAIIIGISIIYASHKIGNVINWHRAQIKEVMKWLIDNKVFEKDKKDKKQVL